MMIKRKTMHVASEWCLLRVEAISMKIDPAHGGRCVGCQLSIDFSKGFRRCYSVLLCNAARSCSLLNARVLYDCAIEHWLKHCPYHHLSQHAAAVRDRRFAQALPAVLEKYFLFFLITKICRLFRYIAVLHLLILKCLQFGYLVSCFKVHFDASLPIPVNRDITVVLHRVNMRKKMTGR